MSYFEKSNLYLPLFAPKLKKNSLVSLRPSTKRKKELDLISHPYFLKTELNFHDLLATIENRFWFYERKSIYEKGYYSFFFQKYNSSANPSLFLKRQKLLCSSVSQKIIYDYLKLSSLSRQRLLLIRFRPLFLKKKFYILGWSGKNLRLNYNFGKKKLWKIKLRKKWRKRLLIKILSKQKRRKEKFKKRKKQVFRFLVNKEVKKVANKNVNYALESLIKASYKLWFLKSLGFYGYLTHSLLFPVDFRLGWQNRSLFFRKKKILVRKKVFSLKTKLQYLKKNTLLTLIKK